MKFVFTLAFAGLIGIFGTLQTAWAYEDCAVESYAHCMQCGARYGYTGKVQSDFCKRHGFSPVAQKKK